jgi:hypothetical protein
VRHQLFLAVEITVLQLKSATSVLDLGNDDLRMMGVLPSTVNALFTVI